jgi:hypothetical protein
MSVHASWVRWVGIILVSGLCAPSAVADPSIARLRACMSEPNDAARLVCYDKEMGRTVKGQPADLGMTPQLIRQKQAEAGIQAPPAPKPEVLSAKVTQIVKRSNGRLVVTLDNGQVWEQQETSSVLLEVGDAVTVTPGVLGSLWMDQASHSGRTRVKRIQ